MVRQLTGPEIVLLRDALLENYDVFTIREFISGRLDKDFFEYSSPFAPFYIQALEFIRGFNMKGWHGELINAYLAEHPENKEISELAFNIGIGPKIYDGDSNIILDKSGLEFLVSSDPFLDVSVFISELSRIERCICRIEIELIDGRKGYGTGVLVGEDLLMSNYHVFKYLIETPEIIKNIVCLFDYNVDINGNTVFKGREVGLSKTPIISYSITSQLDNTGSLTIDDISWPENELDYALVQLAEKISNEPYGPIYGSVTSKTTRGYIKAPEGKSTFYKGSHLFIVQHPDAEPKKIAFGFEKVEGMDLAQQRVRYKINTQPGSSGSPCFNDKYTWVALHNMGDPLHNPKYNQGIPVFRILEHLQAKGIFLN